MLIILTGPPGVGKSVVGNLIAKKVNAVVLRTDIIRRQLFPERKYTKKENIAVHQEMYNRARKYLAKRKDVILDATFIKEEYRAEAKKLAREAKTEYKIIEVTSDSNVVKERIKERVDKGKDASEAEWQHYLIFKKQFEPVVEDHIVIDNSGPLDKTKEYINKIFINKK